MDDREFAVQVERHRLKVFRLVASILGPYCDAEAEEVAQDAFLDAYRNLDRFRGDSRFSTWLYRIAYNCALDRKRLARFRMPHVSPETLAELASNGPGAHALMEAAQQREQVARCLEGLPEQTRTLLYLFYWMECPLREISELSGVPEGTVKSQLARARARFEQLYRAEVTER